jgi:Zn-finger nucleic acid-binding protein
MRCPECGDTDLLMTERQGVEIDYCPTCRGVWLDRGELETIMERPDVRDDHRDTRHNDDHSGHGSGAKKKRGGLLGDLLGGLGGG